MENNTEKKLLTDVASILARLDGMDKALELSRLEAHKQYEHLNNLRQEMATKEATEGRIAMAEIRTQQRATIAMVFAGVQLGVFIMLGIWKFTG
jgi:hypothetical protein